MRLCWVDIECLGVLLIWSVVGEWLSALPVGAGEGCSDIFLYYFSFFSLYLGDGPVSQKAVKHKTIQPTMAQPKIDREALLFLPSAALVPPAKSFPVHSSISSSPVFCLALLTLPFTVPCRIVFVQLDDLEMWPNYLSVS